MADDGRVRVALYVGAPFPACGVGVAGANVLGLEALKFLLIAKFVGLSLLAGRKYWAGGCTYHFDSVGDWVL